MNAGHRRGWRRAGEHTLAASRGLRHLKRSPGNTGNTRWIAILNGPGRMPSGGVRIVQASARRAAFVGAASFHARERRRLLTKLRHVLVAARLTAREPRADGVALLRNVRADHRLEKCCHLSRRADFLNRARGVLERIGKVSRRRIPPVRIALERFHDDGIQRLGNRGASPFGAWGLARRERGSASRPHHPP